MWLRPVPYVDPREREKLKPKVGDTVLYEGVQYIVDQVGMKYVNMRLVSNPKVLGWAKLSEVYKYFEPEPDDFTSKLKNLLP